MLRQCRCNTTFSEWLSSKAMDGKELKRRRKEKEKSARKWNEGNFICVANMLSHLKEMSMLEVEHVFAVFYYSFYLFFQARVFPFVSF